MICLIITLCGIGIAVFVSVIGGLSLVALCGLTYMLIDDNDYDGKKKG